MRPASAAAIALLLALPAAAQPRFDRWTSPALTRFADDREFARYLADLRAEARARGIYWAQTEKERAGTIVIGGAPPSLPDHSDPGDPPGVDHGSRRAVAGRFLLVMEDDRLFSIDTGGSAGEALSLADRVDVGHGSELLVSGDRIFVAGRHRRPDSYGITAFRLRPDGRAEPDGRFEIRAPDRQYNLLFWDVALAGDSLLVYAPVSLKDVRGGRRLATARIEAVGRGTPARRLAGARDLYRPLARTLTPSLHSLWVCPLSSFREGAEPACRGTGLVAPPGGLAFATSTDAFIFAGADPEGGAKEEEARTCEPSNVPSIGDVTPTLVYRVPLAGGAPSVAAVRGYKFFRPAVGADERQLHLVLNWTAAACNSQVPQVNHLAYAALPFGAFGPEPRELPEGSYVHLPAVPGFEVAARMTRTHLLLGPRREYADDEDGQNIPVASRLTIVPLDRPAMLSGVALEHNIGRIEPLGAGVLVTGGRTDQAGLQATVVALGAQPLVAASLVLPGREALYRRDVEPQRIVARPSPGGAWHIALPTLGRPSPGPDGTRIASDVDVLTFGSDGQLLAAGRLASSLPPVDPDAPLSDGERDADPLMGYRCRRECINWMERTRPFWIGERLFALTATELIEGRLEGGRLVEVRRLDFARARPRSR